MSDLLGKIFGGKDKGDRHGSGRGKGHGSDKAGAGGNNSKASDFCEYKADPQNLCFLFLFYSVS